MKVRLELEGQRFGKLLVKSPAYQNKYGGWFWNCECDCGNKTVVSVGHLRDGHTKSCGCLNRITKHGMCGTPEYNIWRAMVQRCSNPKYQTYRHYGGRGISVCDRWMRFENFYADMGERPTSKLTIERENNNDGYSPDNCIWADWTSQSRNKRLSVRNTSGHVGVSWNERLNKWIVRIMANYKDINLGSFIDLPDAIAARKFGEFKYWEGRGIGGI